MALPRMRTAKQAFDELKRLDPNTAIKEYHIRVLMRTGRVPTVRVGERRVLVNFDTLLEVLADPNITLESPKSAGIRKIDERRAI